MACGSGNPGVITRETRVPLYVAVGAVALAATVVAAQVELRAKVAANAKDIDATRRQMVESLDKHERTLGRIDDKVTQIKLSLAAEGIVQGRAGRGHVTMGETPGRAARQP